MGPKAGTFGPAFAAESVGARAKIPLVLIEPFRVRFDECTPEGTLRTSVYLRYMQETASVHSSKAGYDRDWYRRAGLFWLVRTLDLQILRPSRHDEILHVSTAVTGFRRIWARRESEVRDTHGTLLATGEVDWVMTTVDGRPTRIPDELTARFPAVAQTFLPKRVEPGAPLPDAITQHRHVEPHELDPMGHVNNAVYVDYLEAALHQAGAGEVTRSMPRRYRLEYLLPAEPGMRLTGAVWRQGAAWAYRLRASDGPATPRSGRGEDLVLALIEGADWTEGG